MSSKKKEKHIKKKIGLSTVNKTLNTISKPKRIRKVFFLSNQEKKQRMDFLLFMKKHSITPHDIFLLMRVYLLHHLILINLRKSELVKRSKNI